jgi:hypothetical protein
MAKTIYVTSAQRAAAQYIVERDAARGRETPPAVKKIAAASKSGRQHGCQVQPPRSSTSR